MGKYSLTKLAAKDFEKIFEFGIDTFGLGQAIEYQKKLEERFNILVDYPNHYPAVNHIFDRARMSVLGAHAIYYQFSRKASPNRAMIQATNP